MKILLIGHSHLNVLAKAAQRFARNSTEPLRPFAVQLRAPEFRAEGVLNARGQPAGAKSLHGVRKDVLREALARHADCDATVLCINGNEHTVLGLLRGTSPKIENQLRNLRNSITVNLDEWLGFLMPIVPKPVWLSLPPPPVELESDIRRLRKELGADAAIESAETRMRFWQTQCEMIREAAQRHGVHCESLPQNVFSGNGFLAAECIGNDVSHGNATYGDRVLERVLAWLARAAVQRAVQPAEPARQQNPGPYAGLPAHAFWKRAVAALEPGLLDPVVDPVFRIAARDRVATAGSCFAQHISRRLRGAGFEFMQAEPAGDDGTARYDFSAQYGNVYTSRQLLQLLQRALGAFAPLERAWKRPDGRFCDPFRPRWRADGFAGEREVIEAADAHLACVRRMFAELDVFVFTLGMTECWTSVADGAAWPLAPGVAGGCFDAARHRFVNLTVAEVIDDLGRFLAALRELNSRARVILTVSPVPLVATATGAHVIVANTRSKAVLRAAVDEIAASHDFVCYFPSYEIIRGAQGSEYFEQDLRSVSAAGIDHVMRVFMQRMTSSSGAQARAAGEVETIEELIDRECDEEALDR